MSVRKTVHPTPALLRAFYYAVTALFRPAFNPTPDDGPVKITLDKGQLIVMNLKPGPSDIRLTVSYTPPP